MSSELIDTTEMYLRTIFELQEEGTPALRARIAERLGQSGPTVSQTVARMERDGLLEVTAERKLRLTDEGQAWATRVMRKHRLAERLLVDILGVDVEHIHAEACRWEHVMSDTVERRIVEMLGHPTHSPFGNRIPGLEELMDTAPDVMVGQGVTVLSQLVRDGDSVEGTVERLSESLQQNVEEMSRLVEAGIATGVTISVVRKGDECHFAGSNITSITTPVRVAGQIFVTDVTA